MKKKNIIKETLILISPFLSYAVLIIPYNILNQLVIVKLLGCGCPQIDENGNVIENYFNANDFTKIFWLFIAIASTIYAFIIANKIIKNKIILKILYVIVILIMCLLISYRLTEHMMWN